MLDQFQPWYFGVAYAFLFKYCTGMPDMPEWSTRPRYRRPDNAPRVPTSLWVRVMSRRVEAQLARDWNFGYASWNFLFRSTINLSRTLYSYEGRSGDAGSSMTAKQLEEGAVSLCKALSSHYKDTNGKLKPVKGDMTKLRYVPGLSRAAQRLLQNLEHTSRKVPGTQETRRQMRFDTHANRVRYGVPIFVTFSPDEAHNLLMVKLSRERRNDPVLRCGEDSTSQRYCGREAPCVTQDPAECLRLGVPLDVLLQLVPSHAERRAILARDPLAAVDGFRILVSLTYEHLFGMRVCPFCPDCNNGEHGVPCQELFGSNASPEGGLSVGRTQDTLPSRRRSRQAPCTRIRRYSFSAYTSTRL